MMLSSVRLLNYRSFLRQFRYAGTIRLTESHKEFLQLVREHGTGDIKLDVIDNIAKITISNTATRNSVTGRMMMRFATVVDEIESWKELRVQENVVGLIIQGAGKDSFCAGADFSLVKTIVNTSQRGSLMSSFMTDATNRLRNCGLISVAFINGPAIGGGAELTTIADFRIMPMSSSVYIEFVHAKLGACPGWGGARRITSIVGRKEALKLCVTSRRIAATEAIAIGLVDEAITDLPALLQSSEKHYSDEEYDDAIFRACRDFLDPYLNPRLYPGSVRAIKEAIASVEYADPSGSKQVEADMFASRWFSSDNSRVFESTVVSEK
jgi:enoyl-CoA hydratase/carnithine racemase